jgi:hypothetical protein
MNAMHGACTGYRLISQYLERVFQVPQLAEASTYHRTPAARMGQPDDDIVDWYDGTRQGAAA